MFNLLIFLFLISYLLLFHTEIFYNHLPHLLLKIVNYFKSKPSSSNGTS
jgi:hypothetical protein